MRIQRALAAVLLVSFAVSTQAARVRTVAPPVYVAPRTPPADQFSFAEPSKIRVSHVSLDLTVDFDETRLRGTARLYLRNLSGTDTLLLDERGLDISAVSLDDGSAAAWEIDSASIAGSRLRIAILPSTRYVTIAYRTGLGAEGLLWNTASQSYGRKSPYLYTQNESTHARTWIPIQDTPAVRMTYDATIHVPPGMLALMSADNPTSSNASGVYTFQMNQTVPAYLIALGVGRLEFRAIGPRTGVYAEPELIDDAAIDLAYMERMLEAAERVIAPYPWGRWDILLMPPTYIAGGMEHPRINFINPFSVVSQDRPSNPLPSSLLAHELSHSWAGDQVTTATWSDTWLNEGITSYLTVRILEEMSGPERAEYTLFTDRQSFAAYAASNTTPADNTRLHRPFGNNQTADASFGAASYQKGELFLHTIESTVGRPAIDALLDEWFSRYAFDWVDERAFLALLQQRLTSDQLARLDATQWVYAAGLPSNVAAPTSSAIYDRVTAQVQAFRGGRSASLLDTTGWTSVEETLFLSLTRTSSTTRVAELDAKFHFSSRMSPPTPWLDLAISTKYAAASSQVERFLARGGTNSQMTSLWATLAKTDLPKAKQLFALYGDRYDSSVRAYIEYLLKNPQNAKVIESNASEAPHAYLMDEWR